MAAGSVTLKSSRAQSEELTPRMTAPRSVPISEIRPLTASPPLAVSPTRRKLPEFQAVNEPCAANSSSSEPPARSYITRRSL